MESLYVCLFSNGHIKVGRSLDANSRIAAHAERVACMGVELTERFNTEAVSSPSKREAWLIARCAEVASRRFQSEWFEGLDFHAVCQWATQASLMPISSIEVDGLAFGFGAKLREARIAAGLTQAQLGVGLAVDGSDLLKAAISTWELERNAPNVRQLRLICERLDVSADGLLGLLQPA